MKYSNYALRASPCNFQRAKHTQLASSTYFQAWYLGKSSLHFWEYSGSGYTTNIPLTSVQPGGGGVMEEWSTPVNTIHERTCWLDERFQILDSNNAQLSGIDPSSDVFERHMNSFGERMFSQKTANYKTTKKAPCWMCGLIWSWYGVCISKQNDTHVLTSGSSLKVGPVDAGAGAGAVVTDTLLW